MLLNLWRGGVEANVKLTICIFLLGNSNENQVRGLPISSMSLFYIFVLLSLCVKVWNFFFSVAFSFTIFQFTISLFCYHTWPVDFNFHYLYFSFIAHNTFFKSSVSLFVTPCSLELFSSLLSISLSTHSYFDSLNIWSRSRILSARYLC